MSEVSPGDRTSQRRRKAGKSPHRPRKNKPRKQRKEVDSTKTAKALRQVFTHVTDADLAALLDPIPLDGNLTPLNGAEATGSDSNHALFEDVHTQFPDRIVSAVFDAVRHSGSVPFVEERINDRKQKPGRPVALPYRALVVGFLLTAVDGKGCLCSEVARTLYRRISPASMRLLDLTPLPATDDPVLRRRQRWMTEKRVRKALQRFLVVLDPSIHPKGRSMPWEELRSKDKPLTEEEIAERHRALSIVVNKILRTPFELLPAKMKQRYEGSAGIDGTPMRVYSRGHGVNSETASTDPDSGFYRRDGNHSEDDKKAKDGFFAFDINLMVAVDDTPGKRQHLPALPLAMHLDRPGVDQAEAAVWMFQRLKEAGHQPKHLACDGLYTNSKPEMFHIPARAAGWRLVLPVLNDQLGVQASVEGLLMVEGHWYCPSIPERLINANKDYRETLADIAADPAFKPETNNPEDIAKAKKAKEAALRKAREVQQEAMTARDTYRARFKGSNDSGTQRWGCPASGAHPAIMCANKPRSEEDKFIGGPVLGVRLKDRIYPDPSTQTSDIWPKPCRQESVTVNTRPVFGEVSPGDDETQNVAAARYAQDLIFGTDEHTDTYNVLRQSQEGFHGFAKDDAYEALGTPGKRRVRGLAAQSLFAAFLLAAAGIRKIRRFLSNAIPDERGDLYIKRVTRTGDHATTHYPPGTPGARGDPLTDHPELAEPEVDADA